MAQSLLKVAKSSWEWLGAKNSNAPILQKSMENRFASLPLRAQSQKLYETLKKVCFEVLCTFNVYAIDLKKYTSE